MKNSIWKWMLAFYESFLRIWTGIPSLCIGRSFWPKSVWLKTETCASTTCVWQPCYQLAARMHLPHVHGSLVITRLLEFWMILFWLTTSKNTTVYPVKWQWSSIRPLLLSLDLYITVLDIFSIDTSCLLFYLRSFSALSLLYKLMIIEKKT